MLSSIERLIVFEVIWLAETYSSNCVRDGPYGIMIEMFQ